MTSKKPTYLLFTVFVQDNGDHPDSKYYDTDFLTDKDLEDLKRVQTVNGVKQWTDQDPATWESWTPGTGAIVQYRGVHIKPIRIVEQWGYTHDKSGDF